VLLHVIAQLALVASLFGGAALNPPPAQAGSPRSAPQRLAPQAPAAPSVTCSALSGVINDYWPGTISSSAGSNTIQLGSRRTGGAGQNINSGDMLLVIQVMGADINYSNTADYGDGPGGLTGSGFISNTNFVAGRYEYVLASNSVGASGGTLTILGKGASNGLVNSYVNANATSATGPRRFQVVRVPQCAAATLTGDLTALPFDGFTGGIVALDVSGPLNMNGRKISVTGQGYRGGGEGNVWYFCHRQLYYVVSNPYFPGPTHCHAPKGEGFAGTPIDVRVGNVSMSATLSQLYPGGSWATGAPANAGGGGTLGNSGGGGGGNGGAGGKGGWGSNSGGFDRIDNGGFGGAAFPSAFGVSRIVMGGGGGSGEGDTAGGYFPTFGGAGGGLVLVRTVSVQGVGTVEAEGAPGLGSTISDPGGGGGAGGTIVFVAQSGPLSGVSLFARGGKGGNASNYCHQFGGGGGGGRIFFSHSPATVNASAGARGDATCPDPVPPATAGTSSTISLNDIPGCGLGGCLTPFGKSNPPNNATNQPANLTLSWGPSTGVDHYRYCYSTTNGCTPSTNNGTNTSVNLTGLTPGATYYWQVRACADSGCTVFTDADGPSGHWNFTVVSAPGSFNKTAPSNGATGQPANVTLQWGAASGVNHYRYCYSTTNGCTPSTNNGTNTSVNLTGLTPGATYYWQVRACADSGCTVFTDANGPSGHWNFTVVSAPSGSSFSKLSPNHTATNLPTNLTLSWGTAGGVVDKYEYCVSTTASCSAWTDVGLNTSASVVGLAAGTLYYWQVRACNSAGCTEANSGSFWSFQTAATVGSFNKLAPSNGAINVNTNTAQLLWTTAANANDYKLCLGTAPNNCNIVGGGPGQFTSLGNTYFRVLNDLPLQPNTTYYWQVLATNGTYTTPANGSTLAFWSFTTLPNGPDPFNKLSPSFNATNVPTQNVTFQWQAATGAVSYTVCVGAFAGDCAYSLTSAATSAVLTGPLPAGATLVWQVTAHNAGGSTGADNNTWWPFTTVPNAPQAFTKINPPNNATDQPLGVNLTWQDTPDETYYSVCVGTSIGVCSLVNTTTTVASYALTGLDYGTQYYWQVSACNAGGCTPANNSVVWGFKTLNPPVPGPFQKTHPVNGAVGAPTNPAVLQLTWTAADQADGYEVCMGTVPGACDLSGGGFQDVGLHTARYINQLPFSVTLQPGATYYWQVRAYNNVTATRTFADNGVDFYFVTQSSSGPAAFSKDAPLNGSFNLPTASLTLKWFAAAGATSYEVCAGTAVNSCDAMPGNAWLNVGSALSYTLSNLAPGTNYFWQVRAKNGAGNTPANGGVWWQFSTKNDFPPAEFAKQSPPHLATGVVTTGLTLSWTASTGATGYRVCIGSAPGLCEATGGWVNVGNNTSWVVTPALQAATTYWWQVQALGGTFSVQANGGQWWAFTTQPDGPAAFGKLQPPQSGIGVPTATAVLSWTAALGASSYEVCLGTQAGLCDVTGNWVSAGGATSWNAPVLQAATTYWWQVRAVNGSGGRTQADGGAWWHFTTVPSFGPNPPAPFGKVSPLNNAANQPVNPTLSWGVASGATSYQVCVGSLPGDCSSSGGWVSVAGTSYALSGLSYDTTYWWQVRAVNASGQTLADSGAWWRFTTGNNPASPLGTFGKSAPAANATGVPTNTTLSWSAATNAQRYTVCVGTLPGLCDVMNHVEVLAPATSLTLTNAQAGRTYWWQVWAYNGGQFLLADSGQWWAFTTANNAGSGPGGGPAEFQKVAPISGTLVGNTPLLSWTASSGAVGYFVCVGRSWGLCDVVNNAATAGLSHAPNGLAPGTYWWQVTAVDAEGDTTQADGGTRWQFIVVNNLLGGSLDNVDTRKEVTPTQVRIGDLVTYTIVLSNSGGMSVTVRVSDTLVTALTLVGATPGYAQSGQTVVWENVLVPAGSTTALTITAQVNTNALSNPTVNNGVVISSYADGEPPLVRDADPVNVEVYRAFLPIVQKPLSAAFLPVVIRP
jgi:uncharacterized repeat protein (TIGR01451 family)